MSKLNWKAALTVCGLCLTAQHNPAWGQTRPDNVSKEVELEEIVVSSTRIGNKGSLSNSKVDGSELQETNMGENLPYLLQRTPSLVVTSDDGLGIGYVYFRVRGTDQSRINMTINGVPLNDSESQSVFWVNMTDMVGSMGSLDVQRGVGTSTNGAAAFGASVNMQTEKPSARPYAEVSFNGGSYNTFRESVKAGTGIMKGGFAIDARYSKVNSDGYIDHASSDLYSYYASAAWYGQQTMVKLLAFGGAERTGIGWDGISPDTWRDNPRYNGAGEYTDADGSTQYYENNTDNYRQQHFQAHVSHMFDRRWSLNAALHYTNGYGYSEQVKTDEAFADYGMALPSSGITEGNLIRRKYLDNDFYGATFAANYRADRLQLTLGGAANNYEGAHFGEIINVVGMDYDGPLGEEYYRNQADKLDANVYAKANWEIVKGLSVYGDLQYRFIRYRLDGINDEDMQPMDMGDDFHFFNPKAGITYQTGGHNMYANFATAHREPTRDNYTEGGPNDHPTYETLYDYEAGYSYSHRVFSLGVNLYYMDYDNQLILTGKLSDTGAALTRNVKDSYRMGIELMGGVQLGKHLRWDANLTLSRNKIQHYTDWVDDWNADWDDPAVAANSGQVQVDYGTVDIAFSPNITAGSTFTFDWNRFNAALQTNYVGAQYLDNTMNAASQLPAYCVSNLSLAYTLPIKKVARDITFRVQMNNLFNEKYVSNGWSYSYFEGADANGQFLKENQKYDVGYFAQAPFNIHAGFTLRF